MIRHMIIRLNKDADPKEMYEKMTELFKDASAIEGVRKAEVYISNHDLKQSYDLMVRIHMKKSALKDFENSSLYATWKRDFDPYISKVTVFDC